MSPISAHSAVMVFKTDKGYSMETLEEAGLRCGWEARSRMLTESLWARMAKNHLFFFFVLAESII